MSSISEILEFIKAGAKPEREPDRAKKDFELWKAWKDSGEHPDKFRPLLQQFRPALKQAASRWMNQDLPPAVIHAEFNKQFLNAARQFDPVKYKNVPFGAYVKGTCFKKVSRYFTFYQNPARIVETRSSHQRGLFNNAVAVLTDQFGREPTNDELSDQLGWAPAEVGRARKEGRGAFYTGSLPAGMEDMQEKDYSLNTPSRDTEVLKLIKPQLSDDEKLVYEYLIGDGREKLKPGEIATKLGWNPSKVTRHKNSIAEKVEKYL